jgi:hypothetical protein
MNRLVGWIRHSKSPRLKTSARTLSSGKIISDVLFLLMRKIVLLMFWLILQVLLFIVNVKYVGYFTHHLEKFVALHCVGWRLMNTNFYMSYYPHYCAQSLAVVLVFLSELLFLLLPMKFLCTQSLPRRENKTTVIACTIVCWTRQSNITTTEQFWPHFVDIIS